MSIIDPRTQKQNPDDPNAPQQTSFSTTSNTGGQGRSASFSNGQANQQGSGRFTNLQKYIDANQGAGENVANRMSNAVVGNYDNFNKDFNNQIGDINSNIQKGNDALNTQGEQYKTTLGGFNNQLGTFNSMTDRDQFNTANQGLIDFNKNSGADFNKFRTGQVVDETALNAQKTNAGVLADQTIGNIQKQQQGIQTEAGRYDLLKQARPKLQDYTSGQGRLDQLFFQATPNAVNNLQNTYGSQIADARNKQGTQLSNIGNSIADVTGRESQYQSQLQNLANTAQDTFYNKLNQQSNFDQVNDARTALYNDYLNQLQTGKVSSDLANTLGVAGMGGQGYKNGTIGPAANQFTQYNTGRDVSDYLTHNTAPARNFQDILTQPDYDAYSALQGISGRDTGKAYGTSNLGSVVSANTNDYRTELLNANNQFNDTYTKDGKGIDANFYSTGIGASTPRSWEVFKDLNPNLEISPQTYNYANVANMIKSPGVTNSGSYGDYINQATGAFNSNNPFIGSLATAQSGLNVDQYLNSGAQNNAGANMIGSSGVGFEDRAAESVANQIANERLKAYQAQLNQTGVKNVATLTDQDTQALEQYKRFKGLL